MLGKLRCDAFSSWNESMLKACLACRHKVIGMILVKELALVDKHANTPLSTLKMRSLPFLRANMPLYDLLRLFETGRCHMAVLSEAPEGKGGLASFEGPLTPPHPATPDALQGHQLEDLHPLVALEQDQVIQNQVRSTTPAGLGTPSVYPRPHGMAGTPHGVDLSCFFCAPQVSGCCGDCYMGERGGDRVC